MPQLGRSFSLCFLSVQPPGLARPECICAAHRDISRYVHSKGVSFHKPIPIPFFLIIQRCISVHMCIIITNIYSIIKCLPTRALHAD